MPGHRKKRRLLLGRADRNAESRADRNSASRFPPLEFLTKCFPRDDEVSLVCKPASSGHNAATAEGTGEDRPCTLSCLKGSATPAHRTGQQVILACCFCICRAHLLGASWQRVTMQLHTGQLRLSLLLSGFMFLQGQVLQPSWAPLRGHRRPCLLKSSIRSRAAYLPASQLCLVPPQLQLQQLLRSLVV